MTSMAHLKTVAFRASDFRVPPFVVKKDRGVTEISREYVLNDKMLRMNITGHDKHTLSFSLRKGRDGRMLMQFSIYNYDYHLVARENRPFVEVLKAMKGGKEVFSAFLLSVLENWIDVKSKEAGSLAEVTYDGMIRAIEQIQQSEIPDQRVVRPVAAGDHRYYHNHRVQAA